MAVDSLALVQESAPSPAAPGWRLLAFCLDYALATVIMLALLEGFLLPHYHGIQLTELSEQLLQSLRSADGAALPTATQDAVHLVRTVMLSVFWFYFTVSEWALKGSSLGKRFVRLQSARWAERTPPSYVESLLRGGLKAISLIYIPLTLINLAFLFLHKQKRAGHDLLARTWVIDQCTQPFDTKSPSPD